MLTSGIGCASLLPKTDYTGASDYSDCAESKKKMKLSRIEHEQHELANHIILDISKPFTPGIHIIQSTYIRHIQYM